MAGLKQRNDGYFPREFVSRFSANFGESDISELLRLNGLRDLSEVEKAHLERYGQVSAIA